jgi:hypothetical protein
MDFHQATISAAVMNAQGKLLVECGPMRRTLIVGLSAALRAPTLKKRSATSHPKCSFRQAGSFEFQPGRSFVNLLEVVLAQLDVHRTEVFFEPIRGTIEITVNDAKDADDLQAIQMHLKHIAVMFSNGDFSMPMFVQGQTHRGRRR